MRTAQNSPRSTAPLVLLTTSLALALACAQQQPAPEATAHRATRAAVPPAAPEVAAPIVIRGPEPVEAITASGREQLDAVLASLREQSIFFGYDDAALSPDARSKLAAVGDILSKNPTLAVQVEGNCDERGSREYNLALGQRRAETAKEDLVRTGAKTGQVTALSYGAERPRAQGHDEASWAANRRDDVVSRADAVSRAMPPAR
jgi:peptidoglycan-associated lipoprotein